ncbi:MAG: EAL domain-containing protein [Solirubrobacterales bacterium]
MTRHKTGITHPLEGTAEDFRRLVEAVPAIVYKAEMGASGRWLFVSPQIESILGYTPDEWMSDPNLWYRSIHPDDVEHAMSFEDTRLVGLELHPPAEYRLESKSGKYVWIWERARLISDEDGTPVWHGVMQDITAVKAAEREIEAKVAQQVVIANLGEMAMQGEQPDRLIAITAELLAKQEGVSEVSVWEQENFAWIHLCHSTADETISPIVPYETDRFPGNHLANGEIVSIVDWQADPRVAGYLHHLDPSIRSTMLIPINGSRNQFGFLSVHSTVPHHFTEQDGHFLLSAANVLANAIERHRADESLHHQLHHDPLTDLPNRQLFIERLGEAIELVRKSRGNCAVLFLDIDHFKLINDGIGHHAGDEILREVAPRLSSVLRKGDTVARFGGDEFGIVLHSVEGEDDAHDIADRLLDSLNEPINFDGLENFVTASIGIAIYRAGIDEGQVAEDLIQEADAAMYQAKEMGRAQAQVFGKPMREKALRRLEVERELRYAIDQDQLLVHYQPIVSLRTGRIRAFEALVRWQHPVNGLIPPLDFIPIAEESGLISQIDTWVLDESLRQMSEWQTIIEPDRTMIVAVNASSRQIRRTGLTDLVSSLLEKHGVEAQRLALEITESVLVVGTSTVKDVLGELHEMGVTLAIDDFGTGFSSLSYLNDFPLDAIKIDRAFVEHLGNGDLKGSAIADAIVQIGRSLSLKVVAEAVSSETQLQMVRDLGCNMAQGFLLSRPVSADVATRLLEEDRIFISGVDPSPP